MLTPETEKKLHHLPPFLVGENTAALSTILKKLAMPHMDAHCPHFGHYSCLILGITTVV
jgi:hypothetical protein